jgi:hypothetical protein
MEFILTHLDLSSFNSDKELLEEIVVNDQIVVQVTIACVNILEYFTSIELDEENEKSVNPDVSVWDILTTMQTTSSFFKFLTDFILGKFEKLVQLVLLINFGVILTGSLKIDKVFMLKTMGFHIG